jgi:hypothetical protein
MPMGEQHAQENRMSRGSSMPMGEQHAQESRMSRGSSMPTFEEKSTCTGALFFRLPIIGLSTHGQ